MNMFSGLPQSTPVVLAIHVGSRALYHSLPEIIFVEEEISIPVNLLLLLFLLQSCIRIIVCDHLLCTICTDTSSLTSRSKCNKVERIIFDPFPLDYRIICLAFEHALNYRKARDK